GFRPSRECLRGCIHGGACISARSCCDAGKQLSTIGLVDLEDLIINGFLPLVTGKIAHTPSRPFVWIALFSTTLFLRQSFEASVTSSANNRLSALKLRVSLKNRGPFGLFAIRPAVSQEVCHSLEMSRPHEARSCRVTCVLRLPAHWATSHEPLA